MLLYVLVGPIYPGTNKLSINALSYFILIEPISSILLFIRISCVINILSTLFLNVSKSFILSLFDWELVTLFNNFLLLSKMYFIFSSK